MRFALGMLLLCLLALAYDAYAFNSRYRQIFEKEVIEYAYKAKVRIANSRLI